MVAIMNKFPKANFAIEGHTDSDGKASSNLALSNQRANAVMNYFVSNGISSSRLSAQGFGEDYPVDTNSTRAGKANNRRVVVKVTN
jgi:outer membrane protein OmpA-like peptidoglycan-associated protein